MDSVIHTVDFIFDEHFAISKIKINNAEIKDSINVDAIYKDAEKFEQVGRWIVAHEIHFPRQQVEDYDSVYNTSHQVSQPSSIVWDVRSTTDLTNPGVRVVEPPKPPTQIPTATSSSIRDKWLNVPTSSNHLSRHVPQPTQYESYPFHHIRLNYEPLNPIQYMWKYNTFWYPHPLFPAAPQPPQVSYVYPTYPVPYLRII